MPEIKREIPYLSVKDASSQFDGRWLVMRVREMDELRTPLAGEIVYHSKRRDLPWRFLSRTLPRVAEEVRQTDTPFYVFHAEAHAETSLP